ncbi:MAG TPA: large conductance mechanosensitive channel protein MscL [Ruminococcaceae bacterium]|nr:large conductance mechanosensitive channel protein MscL [Oscillospiraceae bacterium]
MKKFFEEFKAFISKGNVMDLAVGVIIGGAFSAIVTSLTDNIINPLINCIGGAEIQGKIHLIGDNYIDYGAFLSAVINFVIMAFIIFCIVKAVNKAMSLGKKKTEATAEEPTTKICPFCKSEIPIDAVKCCHCTSDIPSEEKE